jgi:hypothetical protein
MAGGDFDKFRQQLLRECNAAMVVGTVRLDGRPVEGVKIVLISEAGEPVSTCTDSEGKFRFPHELDLKPGRYHKKIIFPGEDERDCEPVPTELEAGPGIYNCCEIDRKG